MKTRLTHRALGAVRTTGLALLVVCLSGLTSRALALCDPYAAGFMFDHPDFRDTIWSRALQEQVVAVDDSVCSLSISGFSSAPAFPTTYSVLASATGEFYLSSTTWERAPHICGLPSFTVAAPQALSVSAPAGTPFHVVSHAAYTSDSLLLAVKVAVRTVRVYAINTSTAAVTDSIDVMLAGGSQEIQSIDGDADTLGGQDTGIWVGGTRGMIRHVPFDGATWAAEENFDVANTYTIQAIGEGYAGATDGTIFENQGAAFAVDTQPITQPILRIGRDAAVGAAGSVVVRDGATWNAHAAAAADYVRYNLIKHSTGSSVELVASDASYSLHTYRDDASSLQTFWPGVRTFMGGAEDIPLTVVDPDSNQAPPLVEAITAQNGIVSLLRSGSDTLLPRQPELASVFDVTQFARFTLNLQLSFDSVALVAEVLRAAPVHTCTTSFWAADTFRSSTPWEMYDSVRIALGTDTLLISYELAVGASSPASIPRGGAHMSLVIDGRVRPLPLPDGVTLENLALVELFDARGRLLSRAATGHRANTTLRTEGLALPGMYYLRFTADDGPRASAALPLR